MEFTSRPADAMTWPTISEAAKRLESLWDFSRFHQLYFIKIGANGRPQGERGEWAVEVFREGERLGYLARFRVRGGEAVFP